MRAKIDTARFPGRRNKFYPRWADIPRENMRGGLAETPAGRRQRCRGRHRLGRLLVDMTYKSGTKEIPTLTIGIGWRLSGEEPRQASPHYRRSLCPERFLLFQP